MKFLELFSGSRQMSDTFLLHGWDVCAVDAEAAYRPDLCADIKTLAAADIISAFGKPDVIWSSPPCESFSIANHYRSFTKYRKPRNDKTVQAIELHQYQLRLIKELNPTLYFIENPRGLLRKMLWMKPYPRYTITQCQYGNRIQKPTDIWTNHPAPKFRKPCKAGDPCHMASPSSSNRAIKSFKDAHDRAALPKEFCEHIADICDAYFGAPVSTFEQLSLISV